MYIIRNGTLIVTQDMYIFLRFLVYIDNLPLKKYEIFN